MTSTKTSRRALWAGLTVLGMLGGPSRSVRADPLVGSWQPPLGLDMVPVHGATLDSNTVVFFGYRDKHTVNDTSKGSYQSWNPTTNAITAVQPLSDWNPFCSGHAFLGDGELLVAGGHVVNPFSGDESTTVGRIASSPFGGVTWRRGYDKMEDFRWYPTVTTLANGNALIVGGSSPLFANNWNDTNEDYEYFDLLNDRLWRRDYTKRTLPRDEPYFTHDGTVWRDPDGNVDLRQVNARGTRLAGLYPLMHLLPSPMTYLRPPPGGQGGGGGDDGGGSAGGAGGSTEPVPTNPDLVGPDGLLFALTDSFVRLYNPQTNRLVDDIKIDVGGFHSWWTQGSSVLLPIDIDADGNGPDEVRVMLFGGGTSGRSDGSAPAWPSAEIFRYEIWPRKLEHERTVPLSRPRIMGDSILLPDGSIALVGGAEQGYANEGSSFVLEPDLLTPTTSGPGAFNVTPMAASAVARGYHATALLTPDASVVVAGGNQTWEAGVSSGPRREFKNLEVFEPPYRHLGAAPRIHGAPTTSLVAGQRFHVFASQDVEPQIVLIRNGSRTHSLDTDQRMLRLEATKTVVSGGPQGEQVRLDATMPLNPTFAPPGPYMMFVVARAPMGAVGPQSLVPSSALDVLVGVDEGPPCPPDMVRAVRLTVQTGNDNLEGRSSAHASILDESGNVVIPRFQISGSSTWDDYASRTVESAPLTTPVPVSDLRRLQLSASLPSDNWNVARVTVQYIDTAGNVKHLWTRDSDPTPLARLSGNHPAWLTRLDCKTTAPAPAGQTKAIRVRITSGGDDLRRTSRVHFAVLDRDHGGVVSEFMVNRGERWPHDSVRTVEEHFGLPRSVADLQRLRIRAEMDGPDDWDVNRVEVFYLDPAGNWVTFLDKSGVPLATLSDTDVWDSTIPQPSPPPPTVMAHAITLRIRTGGDNLEGDSKVWLSFLDATGAVSVAEFPPRGVSGWDNWDWNEVTVPLTTPVPVADLRRLRFRGNSSFHTGLNGDNWDVAGYEISFDDGSGSMVSEIDGSPLAEYGRRLLRLTGSRRIQSLPLMEGR